MTRISDERLETLCHVINRVANELPWFDTGPQEFNWAVEAALRNSNLPEVWVKAASKPEMTVEYQKSFRALGCCLRPSDLRKILKDLKENDYGEIPAI
jgi:hypothetical protein